MFIIGSITRMMYFIYSIGRLERGGGRAPPGEKTCHYKRPQVFIFTNSNLALLIAEIPIGPKNGGCQKTASGLNNGAKTNYDFNLITGSSI